MNKRWVWVSLVFLACSSSARAEQDFYGIQMRNEAWARYMVRQEKSEVYVDDLVEGPILSHVIHAEGSAKPLDEDKLDIRITVFNDSTKAIPAEYNLRDFYLYTSAGKKYSLVDTQEEIVRIDPRSKATFTPSAGNLVLKNSEIEMVVVSFDLGQTQLFLFPWSKKDAINKLVSPLPPELPLEEPTQEFKRAAGKTSSKKDLWSWLASKKKNKSPRRSDQPIQAASVEAAPAARAPEPAGSGSDERLHRSIKNFVYEPSDGSAGVPEEEQMLGPTVGGDAQVISFDREYNFLTLNLGERDGLKRNMTLSIVRDGKLVAKARVKQVRAAVAAATLLPETMHGEVRAGDRISFG